MPPPPFDSLLWVEGKGSETALSGITADSDANEGYAYSGDTVTAKKGFGPPLIVGAGATSPTTMSGAALSGNRSRSQERWGFPGSSHDWPHNGFTRDLRLPFQEGEEISGYTASNADEFDILMADIVYEAPHMYPKNIIEAYQMSGAGGEVYSVEGSLTTTSGSCTALDGQELLDVTSTQDLWIDEEARYALLGLMPQIGFANGGGVLQVRALSGKWQGRIPNIPLPEQSGVTFDPGKPTFPYEPLEFDGDNMPLLSIISPTAGAHLFSMLIAKM